MGRAVVLLMRRLLWVGFCWLLTAWCWADEATLLQAIGDQRPLTEALRTQAAGYPDGLLLLGWLAEEGRYGNPRDAELAGRYLQQAAEAGSLAAMHYCWGRCLDRNPQVDRQIDLAMSDGDPDGLYLAFLRGRIEGAPIAELDRLLLEAARAGQWEAMGALYADHFLAWAGGNRTMAQAARKLKRCRNEGLVYCYYLSGALHQRRGDSEQALFYFQALQWLDRRLFERHLTADDLHQLRDRLPQQSLEPVRSRVATLLATQPPTGNPQVDRFLFCASQLGSGCVARLAARDDACLPPLFEIDRRYRFRDSDAYRSCLNSD